MLELAFELLDLPLCFLEVFLCLVVSDLCAGSLVAKLPERPLQRSNQVLVRHLSRPRRSVILRAHTEIETLIGTLKTRLAHSRNDGPNPWPSFTRSGRWPAKANANGSGDRQTSDTGQPRGCLPTGHSHFTSMISLGRHCLVKNGSR